MSLSWWCSNESVISVTIYNGKGVFLSQVASYIVCSLYRPCCSSLCYVHVRSLTSFLNCLGLCLEFSHLV